MSLSSTLRRFAAKLCIFVALGVCSAGSVAAAEADTDFHITFRSDADDAQKYLSFGWNGWSGHVVHWRYNDANRPAALVASASAAVARIQSAMSKWTSVCNVQFVYDGSTTRSASLATGTRDGLNVIAWSELSGNATGITYAGASGFVGSTFTLDEADMVINYQFNPDLDLTFAHEVGHMLGLKHSNQEGAVMSGPNTAPDPSTTYTSLGTLQADDVAGCQSLYGAATGLPVAATKRAMVEYRYGPLDYYFITSRDSDKAALDATSGWARTGATFLVYAAQQTGGRSITRFYFDGVARDASRGSHFYTLLDSDLAALVSQNPTQSSAPGLPQNEGVDSYAFLPLVTGVGGLCGSGLLPVYRLFRSANRVPDDPNHRFTTSVSAYNDFVAQGWDGEGVNFCVPSN